MAESGLMRKTKAQLVDIILRKDEVEKKLRKDIDDVNASAVHIANLASKCEELESNISTLIEENTKLTEKNTKLTNDVNERDEVIDKQAKFIEQKEANLEDLRGEYDDAISRNFALAKALRDANNDNKILATIAAVAILVAVIAMFV